MEIKRTVSIYFSPTDGTRRVVRAPVTGPERPRLPELDRTSLEAAGPARSSGRDVAVIGVPVY